MTVLVAWCNDCKRQYRVLTTLPSERIAGNCWHWTRCGECGGQDLGVVDGDWSQHRPWSNCTEDMMVEPEDAHVITFDEEVSDDA